MHLRIACGLLLIAMLRGARGAIAAGLGLPGLMVVMHAWRGRRRAIWAFSWWSRRDLVMMRAAMRE